MIIYSLPTNMTFEDVFKPTEQETYTSSEAKFKALYKASVFYDAVGSNLNNSLTDANISIVFYLLWSNYGQSSIMSNNIEKFKSKLFSMIFQYGPAWQAKLEIQTKVRNLTEAELQTGTKAIHNHAFNPGTVPSTDELAAINEQNTTNYAKSKIEAYGLQWEMLTNDVTNVFINKFRELFNPIAAPVNQLVFEVNDNEN